MGAVSHIQLRLCAAAVAAAVGASAAAALLGAPAGRPEGQQQQQTEMREIKNKKTKVFAKAVRGTWGVSTPAWGCMEQRGTAQQRQQQRRRFIYLESS